MAMIKKCSSGIWIKYEEGKEEGELCGMRYTGWARKVEQI